MADGVAVGPGIVLPAIAAAELRKKWGWFVALGAALIVLGTAALGAVGLVTLASVVFFGWLLMVGGVLQLLHAFGTRGWHGFGRHLLTALLALAVGILIVANPVEGALSITLLLAGFFMATGVVRIIAAVSQRPPAWGVALLGGVVTLVLGVMVWAQWPVSGTWLIGTFVGIDLILDGWGLVMLGLAGRRLPG